MQIDLYNSRTLSYVDQSGNMITIPILERGGHTEVESIQNPSDEELQKYRDMHLTKAPEIHDNFTLAIAPNHSSKALWHHRLMHVSLFLSSTA